MIVARTALWVVLTTGSVAGVAWVSRASWEEIGAGIGAAAAALVLGGAAGALSF